MGASSEIVAVVLAGGRGRRLGEPKMLADLDGRPLLAHALAHAREAGLDAVVVAKPGTPLPPVNVPVLREPESPAHPLLGIVTALRELPDARGIVVLGGDLPFVPPALIRTLAAAPGPLVPVSGGRLEPLVARYDRAQLQALEDALDADAPIHAAIAGAARLEGDALAALDPGGHATFNVNTPGDLEQARRHADAFRQ
jgi:molybdopterin-guanine dinucleotide biosynthesis protein A